MVISLFLIALVWLLPSHGSMICEQRQQSQMIKFVASLIVVVGHQTGFYISLPNFWTREFGNGALCVAFFLFMSGYGLFYGIARKRQILDKKWILKRLVKLIVPALTAMLLYVVSELVVGKEVDYTNLLKYWFVSDENLRYGWFVSEIIVLYMAFWASFRFGEKYAFAILVAILLLSMVVMIIIKSPVWYVQGVPCFLLGMFVAKANLEEINVCRKYFLCPSKKMGMSVLVLFFLCMKNFADVQSVVPILNRWKYMYLSYFASDIVFVSIIAYILMRLPVCPIMKNRGGYFYEIYLVQGATLLLCRKMIDNDFLFIVIGLIVTALVAKVMNDINRAIIKRIKI